MGESIQAKIISENLNSLGLENHVIDFHKTTDTDLFIMESSRGLTVSVGGKKLLPKVIYVANNIRTDAVINIPKQINYPQVYRSRLAQLFTDIRFALKDAYWLPGDHENIIGGDSKPFLFSIARRCGLLIPEVTVNSNFPTGYSSDFCKKPLGFPFQLSINRQSGKEVGITGIVEFSADKAIGDGYYWQWQSSIKTKKQIRCFIADKRVWAVAWNRCDEGVLHDLRQVNQINASNIHWQEYNLPEEISDKLFILMDHLGLRMASPEFILDQHGRHILIDLNPCGDWYGFFPEHTNREIVQKITSILRSAL